MPSTLTKDDWKRERPIIEELRSRNTLTQIIAIMKARGFSATESQYKKRFTQWGNTKYRKKTCPKRKMDQFPEESAEVRLDQQQSRNIECAAIHPSTVLVDCPSIPEYESINATIIYQSGVGVGDPNYPTLPPPTEVDLHLFGEYDQVHLEDFISQPPADSNPDVGYNTIEPLDFSQDTFDFSNELSQPSTDVANVDQAIHRAAYHGHLDTVKTIIRLHGPIDIMGKHDETALYLAAHQGHTEIVEFLLQSGADANVINTRKQRTALHKSARRGHVPIVQLLLKYGSDPDSRDFDGATPLWRAAEAGHDFIVNMMLKNGASIDATAGELHRHAIHQAALNEHNETLKVLLEHLASPDSRDSNGATPILLAAESGNEIAVRLLLEYGADPNACDRHSGQCAIQIVAETGDLEIMQLLIRNNVDIDAAEKTRGSTALMLAAKHGHYESLDMLLKANAEVDIQNVLGASALCIAAARGKFDCANLLLTYKANPLYEIPIYKENPLDKENPLTLTHEGRHPLHEAAQNGHFNIVELLVQHGADVNAVLLNERVTPLVLAAEEGHAVIVEYLHKNGASLVV